MIRILTRPKIKLQNALKYGCACIEIPQLTTSSPVSSLRVAWAPAFRSVSMSPDVIIRWQFSFFYLFTAVLVADCGWVNKRPLKGLVKFRYYYWTLQWSFLFLSSAALPHSFYFIFISKSSHVLLNTRNVMQCPLGFTAVRLPENYPSEGHWKLDDLRPGVQSDRVQLRNSESRRTRAERVHPWQVPWHPYAYRAALRVSPASKFSERYLSFPSYFTTFGHFLKPTTTWIVLTKPSSALLCKKNLAPSKVGLNRKRSDFSDLPNGLWFPGAVVGEIDDRCRLLSSIVGVLVSSIASLGREKLGPIRRIQTPKKRKKQSSTHESKFMNESQSRTEADDRSTNCCVHACMHVHFVQLQLQLCMLFLSIALTGHE